MHPLTHFVSALVLTFFVSRLALRLPIGRRRIQRVLFAHMVSFPVLIALMVLVHGFAGAITSQALMFVV